MNVTLRQLRALATVAELGSFVDAARSMHVTASALSLLITDLEHTLGFRVFDRTTRRVKLSLAGAEYLPHAQRILADLDSAQRCAADLRNQKTGSVRIAASQTLAWMLMPPAFSAFHDRRPDVRLEPLDLPVDQVLPALDAARADLAITLGGSTDADVQAVPLFSSRVHLACRSSHRLAGRKRVRWADLAGEPLVFTGSETPQRINAVLPKGLLLQASWQVEHAGSALALVASGFGCAICAGYVRPMADMHGLRLVPLVEPAYVREFAVYGSRRRALTEPAQAFRDFLVQHFARSGARPVEQDLQALHA
ncbi:MAG TPA: LysR substrate-binding domain-containing protein [Ramlibacter sp.]|nr:LysR substrate-binding domain-containing protein [Ramlibacter sp.]